MMKSFTRFTSGQKSAFAVLNGGCGFPAIRTFETDFNISLIPNRFVCGFDQFTVERIVARERFDIGTVASHL
jgi:hypothetical protein